MTDPTPPDSAASRRAAKAAQARWRRHRERERTLSSAPEREPRLTDAERRWRALAGGHHLDFRRILADPDDPGRVALEAELARLRGEAERIDALGLPLEAAIEQLEEVAYARG